MDYSAEVRQRFDNSREPAAGDAAAATVSGAAADRSLNVWVRFVVAAAGGRITSIRYNAYGFYVSRLNRHRSRTWSRT